jgi:hypothetical protein
MPPSPQPAADPTSARNHAIVQEADALDFECGDIALYPGRAFFLL